MDFEREIFASYVLVSIRVQRKMATPPESPVEEHAYELEPSRTPKPIPVALEELCRQTKFSKQEIRVMYRGFKTVS